MTIGLYIFIAMVCFVVLLTLIGLVHMIRHNCRVQCKVQCCFSCKEEEKEDINLDYGTYYSADGERRDNIMEVSVVFPFLYYLLIFVRLKTVQFQARDQNSEYYDYDYMESNMDNIVRDNNSQYINN